MARKDNRLAPRHSSPNCLSEPTERRFPAMNIEVRDFKFPISQPPRDWHTGGVAVTAYWDQLSVFFPVGERFFVRSVRHFEGQLTDPKP